MATIHQSEAAVRPFAGEDGPRIVGPGDGKAVDLRSLGVRFMIRGEESGGGCSLVEHPIPPRALCAPLRRHSAEDGYRYVLESTMGAPLGHDVVLASAGERVFTLRGQGLPGT